jgi:hypothetical protein
LAEKPGKSRILSLIQTVIEAIRQMIVTRLIVAKQGDFFGFALDN